MINSIPPIRVTLLTGLAALALPVSGLQAQGRSMGMRSGMGMQSMAMSHGMPGLVPAAQMPTAFGMNPNLGLGGFGNLGSPFANPFGTGVWGGGLWWNSRFGPYGLYGPYGYGGGLGYGGLGYGGLGYGGLGYGGAPSPAKPQEQKAAPPKEQPRAEKPAPPRKPDDPNRQSPSEDEILSGKALNSLLDRIRQLSADGNSEDRPDALLQLYVDGLKHINVTRGAGNIALLKNGGRLNWPEALLGPEFQGPRERLTARAAEAVRDAGSNGSVDPATIQQMANDVGQLRQLLRQKVGALSFQPFTEAKAFLQTFDDALVALQQPDAAHHFDGQYALKAQTVLGLVKQMAENGLRFAPALPGDEAAYQSLYQVMAAYNRATLAQAAVQ
jgi:hypothetical protein